MRSPRVVAAALALLSACASSPPRPARPPDLPAQIFLKTPTRTFTPDFLFALEGGRLWVRPNPDRGIDEAWRLLGDGLPDKIWPWFTRPHALRAIYADGAYLAALGDDGIFYSLRWGTGYLSGWGTLVWLGPRQFVWSSGWGFPLLPFQAPLRVNIPSPRGFAFSDRTKFNVGYYGDPNGYSHWLDFGCDTFFALGADGTLIHFADPWLPGGFTYKLTGPHRGRFRAIALSASASTLMVMDARGAIFTRMFDFDIAGEDHYFFSYTYAAGDSGYLRVRLPLPDWVEQPRVPGRITRHITIATVPGMAGNGARELRVEGVDGQGRTGYYRKRVSPFAPGWELVPTGEPLQAPLLSTASDAPEHGDDTEASAYDLSLQGTLSTAGQGAPLPAALTDFNLYAWQPAKLTIAARGRTASLVLHAHDLRMAPDGQEATLRGALMPTEGDPALLDSLLGDRPFVEVSLHLTPHALTIVPDAPSRFAIRLVSAAPITLQ